MESREELLKEWFKDNPKEWACIKAEMFECLIAANEKAIDKNCKDRDFYSGKCCGIKEAMNIDVGYE